MFSKDSLEYSNYETDRDLKQSKDSFASSKVKNLLNSNPHSSVKNFYLNIFL